MEGHTTLMETRRTESTRWAEEIWGPGPEGAPMPLGVTWIENLKAYNFALYAKHAEKVDLLLYHPDNVHQPARTVSLDYHVNKSQRIWHCLVYENEMNGAEYYGYRIWGPPPSHQFEWHAYNPEKILFDPYARALFFPQQFNRNAAIQPGSNEGQAPLGVIRACRAVFDWGTDISPVHSHDTIIYEMHVRGFTRDDTAGVTFNNRGTFRGIIDKIPYLQELGVTVVELMPVFQFDPAENNYWGYMTLNFFSVHNEYTQIPAWTEKINEFREMVKKLHEAGIEVILDVVYNHTAEGNHNGPTYSYKGIDNSTYYLISPNPNDPYSNYTGTGNTIHSQNRTVRRLIMDSLRFWVKEMHVDGFRFDLASIFSRNTDGSLNVDDPPIFGDIANDPDLAHIRLIAEPWCASGVYQLGRNFPGTKWMQWNGKYRDEMRSFIKSGPGLVNTLMQRLYGSDDLFPGDRFHSYHPYQSINYFCSHDGFTMYDLVSYNEKHNLANGHNNTDGENNNHSWNCGWEGDENAPEHVITLRKQQVKNMFTLLMLSNGTPMFLAGDEFMNTQFGNNNPYNQDNETSWLDWTRLEQNRDIFEFCKMIIAFRKNHPSLGRNRFWRDDVRWYGANRDVDRSFESYSLAFFLDGAQKNDRDIYVMINSYWEALTFTFQEAGPWFRVVNTALSHPNDIMSDGDIEIASETYLVGPRSIAVFVR